MDKTAGGLINGLIGVLIFSASLPATRVAVQQFDPVFLTVARAAIAGLLGLALRKHAVSAAGTTRISLALGPCRQHVRRR
jgi:drug/metabolite transporter (DMT)-like permease